MKLQIHSMSTYDKLDQSSPSIEIISTFENKCQTFFARNSIEAAIKTFSNKIKNDINIVKDI